MAAGLLFTHASPSERDRGEAKTWRGSRQALSTHLSLLSSHARALSFNHHVVVIFKVVVLGMFAEFNSVVWLSSFRMASHVTCA